MYGWLWSKLPGGWALKTLQSLAMIAIVGAVLVTVVFPWVEPKLPFSGNTVRTASSRRRTRRHRPPHRAARPAPRLRRGTGKPSAPSLSGE